MCAQGVQGVTFCKLYGVLHFFYIMLDKLKHLVIIYSMSGNGKPYGFRVKPNVEKAMLQIASERNESVYKFTSKIMTKVVEAEMQRRQSAEIDIE